MNNPTHNKSNNTKNPVHNNKFRLQGCPAAGGPGEPTSVVGSLSGGPGGPTSDRWEGVEGPGGPLKQTNVTTSHSKKQKVAITTTSYSRRNKTERRTTCKQ